MNEIEQSFGTAKSPPPRVEKPVSLEEACEYLRSALHFLALAGADILVENAGGVNINVRQIEAAEDAGGDMYFVPVSPPVGSIATPIATGA